MSNKEEKKDEREWWEKPYWIVGVFVLVVVIWWRISAWPFEMGLIHDLKPNAYGDTYGMVNALFSALAFAGVVVAIILQTKELGAQRQEMHTQNEMLDLQRKALEEQRNEMKEMQGVQLLSNRLTYLLAEEQLHKEKGINLDHTRQEIDDIAAFIRRHSDLYMSENEVMTEEECIARIGMEIRSVWMSQRYLARLFERDSSPVSLKNVVRELEYSINEAIRAIRRVKRVKHLKDSSRMAFEATARAFNSLHLLLPIYPDEGIVEKLASLEVEQLLQKFTEVIPIDNGKNQITTPSELQVAELNRVAQQIENMYSGE